VDGSSAWWRRFRRSFGVPDLITDEHARSIIVTSLSPGIGNSGTAVLDPTPAITAIVETAVELAESGQLDDLVLPTSQRILELEGSPRTRIIQAAASRQDWPAIRWRMGRCKCPTQSEKPSMSYSIEC